MMAPAPAAAAAGHALVHFMALDPGQFHAALVHKEMDPRVAPRIDVYGPLGFDLVEHLRRIASFNERPERPTSWGLEVHAGPDFVERMLSERPGNAVVIAGRNARKIDYIERSVAAGLHVLADKPWLLRSADLPRLERVLAEADRRGVVTSDIMTERFEVTNAVQRELVRDPAVFGGVVRGSPQEPAVHLRSVHHVLKTVAGSPLRRPLWWFDPAEQGEALSDVGTHLVDLAVWTLFSESALDYRQDVELLSARAWPTYLSPEQFSRVSGHAAIPPDLAAREHPDGIRCDCNTEAVFALRGVHISLEALWDAESRHGDTHHAVYRGERARVEVRQGEDEGWRPEVYVRPAAETPDGSVYSAVRERVGRMADRWPGIGIEEREDELHVTIPEQWRLGHERHFGEVADRFLQYVAHPAELDSWERQAMLVKYCVTTRGTELSHAD